jgi:hypothetical protein
MDMVKLTQVNAAILRSRAKKKSSNANYYEFMAVIMILEFAFLILNRKYPLWIIIFVHLYNQLKHQNKLS